MEIKGKAHCFFEQSGTFKQEFIKLGIPAEDYDIQNNFGQTDHVIDLFGEIQKGYQGEPSVFDTINPEDLIMAFFPCIYFNATSQIAFSFNNMNYRGMTLRQKTDAIIERSAKREHYYLLLVKMVSLAMERGLRMIIENPWNEQTYLKANFVLPPSVVDWNRMLRGDYRVKPTAYWFINCEPGNGFTYQYDKNKITHNMRKKPSVAGTCNEERSMISPDYARNFICDFILGKPQKFTQLSIFDNI